MFVCFSTTVRYKIVFRISQNNVCVKPCACVCVCYICSFLNVSCLHNVSFAHCDCSWLLISACSLHRIPFICNINNIHSVKNIFFKKKKYILSWVFALFLLPSCRRLSESSNPQTVCCWPVLHYRTIFTSCGLCLTSSCRMCSTIQRWVGFVNSKAIVSSWSNLPYFVFVY